MSPAQLAARCVELLGTVEGPVAVIAVPRLTGAVAERVRIAHEGEPATAAVCAFLDEPADPTARGARLQALAARLPVGAPIVVVDHNQPRQRLCRLLGALALLARGVKPVRAAYPTARELQQHAFVVDCLRLADGERIQLVRAHRT